MDRQLRLGPERRDTSRPHPESVGRRCVPRFAARQGPVGCYAQTQGEQSSDDDEARAARRPNAARRTALASPAASLCFKVESAAAVTSAELIRSAPRRYGRFEARLRFAPGDGVVSSFFLWKDGSERPGAAWNEIDIEKVGTDCRGHSSKAIYGNPAEHHTAEALPALERFLLARRRTRPARGAALSRS